MTGSATLAAGPSPRSRLKLRPPTEPRRSRPPRLRRATVRRHRRRLPSLYHPGVHNRRGLRGASWGTRSLPARTTARRGTLSRWKGCSSPAILSPTGRRPLRRIRDEGGRRSRHPMRSRRLRSRGTHPHRLLSNLIRPGRRSRPHTGLLHKATHRRRPLTLLPNRRLFRRSSPPRRLPTSRTSRRRPRRDARCADFSSRSR
jgi:hypothetical protein